MVRTILGGARRLIGALAGIGLAVTAVVAPARPASADSGTDYELSKLIIDQPISDGREMIGGDPQLSSGHLALDYWLGLDAKDRSLAALAKHVTGAYQRVWETPDARRLFIWAIEFDAPDTARSYVQSFQAGGDHHSPFKLDGIDAAQASFGDKDGIVLEQVGFAMDARAFTVILAGDKHGDHATVTDVARREYQRAQNGPPVDTASTVATVPPVGSTAARAPRIGAEDGGPAVTTAAPRPAVTPRTRRLVPQAVGGAVIVAAAVVFARVSRRRKESAARRQDAQMAELRERAGASDAHERGDGAANGTASAPRTATSSNRGSPAGRR